MSGLMQGID